MTRSDQRRGHAWGVLLLGCAAVWGAGCKKEQPQPRASVYAGAVAVAVADAGVPDAGPVAKVAKPLRFSDVVFKRDGRRLDVTYRLTNPGTAQGRGDACLALLDEKGVLAHVRRLGHIAVKGGTDDVFEDFVYLPEEGWPQAWTVLLYTAAERLCENDDFGATSEPLRLLSTGEPAPAGAPAPSRTQPLTAGELQLSGVTLAQPGGGTRYELTYTVKNVSARRINGRVCLRGYEGEQDDFLLFASMGELSVAPGAEETRTDEVDASDAKAWDRVSTLDLFVAEQMCLLADSKLAPSRIEFRKPDHVHSPDEDATGTDWSDAVEPEPAFPQEPPSSDDDDDDASSESPGN
ncbi:hypothetical protein COCOR_02720 [Corallococcus coralloides DSM 2259]|uniref:Lipoprotein n=1 Tax=Corallococcus coralloides (strain ATCC 25202 / DSM 2259 / NBRC 100086 / M2) TaxID=1144275 RepID=H8MVF5_CORCM|nr:hypothetical protein [Corallococcus coralloides]AFE04778.1 hypothetical protein COCOR_02720 [Corallococcus coralloides DSM 2259]